MRGDTERLNAVLDLLNMMGCTVTENAGSNDEKMRQLTVCMAGTEITVQTYPQQRTTRVEQVLAHRPAGYSPRSKGALHRHGNSPGDHKYYDRKKTVECTQCGKDITARNLAKHVRQVHCKVSPEKVPCEYCDTKVRVDHLRRHQREAKKCRKA